MKNHAGANENIVCRFIEGDNIVVLRIEPVV